MSAATKKTPKKTPKKKSPPDQSGMDLIKTVFSEFFKNEFNDDYINLERFISFSKDLGLNGTEITMNVPTGEKGATTPTEFTLEYHSGIPRKSNEIRDNIVINSKTFNDYFGIILPEEYLKGSVAYSASLFKHNTIKAFSDYFKYDGSLLNVIPLEPSITKLKIGDATDLFSESNLIQMGPIHVVQNTRKKFTLLLKNTTPPKDSQTLLYVIEGYNVVEQHTTRYNNGGSSFLGKVTIDHVVDGKYQEIFFGGDFEKKVNYIGPGETYKGVSDSFVYFFGQSDLIKGSTRITLPSPKNVLCTLQRCVLERSNINDTNQQMWFFLNRVFAYAGLFIASDEIPYIQNVPVKITENGSDLDTYVRAVSGVFKTALMASVETGKSKFGKPFSNSIQGSVKKPPVGEISISVLNLLNPGQSLETSWTEGKRSRTEDTKAKKVQETRENKLKKEKETRENKVKKEKETKEKQRQAEEKKRQAAESKKLMTAQKKLEEIQRNYNAALQERRDIELRSVAEWSDPKVSRRGAIKVSGNPSVVLARNYVLSYIPVSYKLKKTTVV